MKILIADGQVMSRPLLGRILERAEYVDYCWTLSTSELVGFLTKLPE
jgi:hypothetical protein